MMLTDKQLKEIQELPDKLFDRSCTEYNIRTSSLLMQASSAINTLLEDHRWRCAVASVLIEKNTPKKPTYVDIRFRNHGRHVSDGSSLEACYKCPNCQSHIFHVFDSEHNCIHCGQAIDWSAAEGGTI